MKAVRMKTCIKKHVSKQAGRRSAGFKRRRARSARTGHVKPHVGFSRQELRAATAARLLLQPAMSAMLNRAEKPQRATANFAVCIRRGGAEFEKRRFILRPKEGTMDTPKTNALTHRVKTITLPKGSAAFTGTKDLTASTRSRGTDCGRENFMPNTINRAHAHRASFNPGCAAAWHADTARSTPFMRAVRKFLDFLTTLVLCLILGIVCFADPVRADNLPVFDKVIHGQVDFQSTDHALLAIGHNQNNVLQWKSFDVAEFYTMEFKEGNFLNLVRDSKESRIAGTLKGSGSVFIVNPHGVTLAKGSQVITDHFGISTAKITEQMVQDFIDSPQPDPNLDVRELANFTFSEGKGMGKVRLLGEVRAENVLIDAGQIIIRDANEIKNRAGNAVLKDKKVKLQSSVNRIDAGFNEGSLDDEQVFDLNEAYEIKNSDADTVISHQGEIPLADEEDFKLLENEGGMEQDYWLTDNVELDLKEELGGGKTFKGSLDGAYNQLSYDLTTDGSEGSAGLFAALDGAEVSNLALTDSTLTVSEGAEVTAVGALAGKVQNSTLTNLEVSDFNLQAPDAEYAGALTGVVADSKLNSVTAGFASDSAAELKDSEVKAGALAGRAEGELEVSGLAAGLNEAEGLTAVAENETAAAIAGSFAAGAAQAEEQGLSLDDYVLAEDRSEGHLKGFMNPYFVENFEYTYDGTGHDYEELNSVYFTGTVIGEDGEETQVRSEIFNPQDLLTFDNEKFSPDGKVTDAGLYKYELTNTKGLNGFYLVQPDNADGTQGEETLTGSGYIKINKRDLGTIVISDAEVEAGEDASLAITNEPELNFAAGESLSDFNPQITLPEDYSEPGSYQAQFEADGLDKNYTYEIAGGSITVSAPVIEPEPDPVPTPDPEPEVTPDPEPDYSYEEPEVTPALPTTDPELPVISDAQDAAEPGADDAVLAYQNVTPCDMCDGKEDGIRFYNLVYGGLYPVLSNAPQQNFASAQSIAARSLALHEEALRLAKARQASLEGTTAQRDSGDDDKTKDDEREEERSA